jgi:hypothetical protein
MQNIITNSPLLWTGLLATAVLLPVLIHLINRLRHRPVRWAAMEFLLSSHRRNRNRIRLKQLLLLLARIACLLLALFTVGQVGCNKDSMARFLGARVTHHYLVIDDTLSMSDTTAAASALDRARETVGRLAGRIAGRENQRVTMLRLSQASYADLSGMSPAAAETPVNESVFDLNAMVVDRDIERVMLEAADRLQPTCLASSPETALQWIVQLVQQRAAENAIVYLISDFREKDWANPAGVDNPLLQLTDSGAGVELIRCVDVAHENVAVTSLQPAGSVRVAGIPLMMEVQVTNYGENPADKLQIRLQSAAFPDETIGDVRPAGMQPQVSDLPTILIERVAAGETVSRRFPVFFPAPGQHAVRAALADDALPLDNQHWVVTRFSPEAKVLLVEEASVGDGRFVSLAMSPGGMTGLQMETAPKSLLRDADDSTLDRFETIFLLDVDQLEAASVTKLRGYLERGGGIVFFAGPRTNLKHYTTTLYDQGRGIYPLPLERVTAVPEQLDESGADIAPRRHPVFASVLDVDYSPLDLVQVSRVCQPPLAWSLSGDDSVSVLATVRGDERLPLLVEKKVGAGTVLAMLTSAGPAWNNWLRNPTYPATLLLMQDYVARSRGGDTVRQLAGSRIRREWPASRYGPEVEFVAPLKAGSGSGFERTHWTATADSVDPAGTRVAVLGVSPDETGLPGIYEFWRTNNNGERELERLALNVDPAESRLKLASRGDLLAAIPSARIVNWQNVGQVAGSNRGTSLVRVLLLLLLAVLIAEQLLAWSVTCHPRSGHRHRSLSRRPDRHTGPGKAQAA